MWSSSAQMGCLPAGKQGYTGWQRHLVATHLAVLAWSHRVVYVVGCVPDYERTCGIGARRAEGATLRGKTT